MLSSELLQKYNELMNNNSTIQGEYENDDIDPWQLYTTPTETMASLKDEALRATKEFQSRTYEVLSEIYDARKIRDLNSNTPAEIKKERLQEFRAQLKAKLIEASIAESMIKYVDYSLQQEPAATKHR